MRFVYVDEAGTSANEQATIVAGFIVNADTSYRLAERELERILAAVPPKVRTAGYISHAKEIWGSPKLREHWAFESRLQHLHAMMSLPRRLRLPVVLGLIRRHAPLPPSFPLTKLTREQFQHSHCFMYCMGRVAWYMDNFAAPYEVATVVAEDVPSIKKVIRGIVRMLKDQPIPGVPSSMLKPSQDDIRRGITPQDYPIHAERIADVVHFAEKKEAPFLQIADACAFGFRRYFSGQSHGADFVRSIAGIDLEPEDWSGVASAKVFFWERQAGRLPTRPMNFRR